MKVLSKDNIFRLSANPSYWRASKDEKDAIFNGCGSGGSLNSLVPDSLLGLDIKDACRVHDWMYHHGKTKEQRKEADIVFLDNMKGLINKSKSSSPLKFLRGGLAKIYYLGVRIFGGFFFNKKKEVTK